MFLLVISSSSFPSYNLCYQFSLSLSLSRLGFMWKKSYIPVFLLIRFLLLLLIINHTIIAFSINLQMSSSQPASTSVSLLPNLNKLTTFATSYAAANGIQVERKIQSGTDSKTSTTTTTTTNTVSPTSYICAPISLLPNVFPATAFQSAINLAPAYNLLVDRISRDADFLEQALAGDSSRSVISSDPYTRRLYELYRDIYCNPPSSFVTPSSVNFAPIADRFGIHRSDYMLHPATQKEEDSTDTLVYDLKQVELNTVAASFAGLSVQVAKMHSMITKRFKHEIQPWLDVNERIITRQNKSDSPNKGVPENPALQCLPQAIYKAHQRYIERFLQPSIQEHTQPVVLFIVQEGETNTVDQRMLEFHLFQNHGLSVIRMSLNHVFEHVTLNEETGALFVFEEGQKREVSIVYFRAGYAPTDYPDGDHGNQWKARERLERSRATKCPSLGYHLAGTKKVQQSVARPGVLERFFNMNDPLEQAMVQSMRQSFAGLYSLGEDATKEDLNVVKDIVLSGHEGNYVLKPQREGGGYNYYGHNLAKKLRENVDTSEDGINLDQTLAEFILMERLFPPSQDAILIRGGLVEGIGKTISELGCFGSILVSYDGARTFHNEYAGFLLRTKFNGVDEGGVASGFATLSSPYLC